jgi:ABC-type branched-subunit amino acid transport system substrate-binding protein/serine/threonine protein kinase
MQHEGTVRRCPRCQFVGTLVDGGCARCGFGRRLSISSKPLSGSVITRPKTVVSGALETGTPALLHLDMLRQGRYRLLKPVDLPRNQRQQGKAWLAIDARQSGNQVLIREILMPPPGSPEQEQRLLRDVAIRMTQLGQQEGFPHVFDMFGERGSYYIVLEQIEGKSLAQLVVEQGVLPERAVAEYGRQICKLLNILESQRPPIVHGAITPDTIIISPDNRRASLIHVPLYALPRSSSDGRNQQATASGYQAPEQVRGASEPASDIYGLGGTLHHALTGYDPDKHMSFFFPPARRLNPSISSRMEAILSHALRLSLTQRYAEAGEMQSDLDYVLTSLPITGPNRRLDGHLLADINGWKARRRRRDRFSVASFVIVAALVCVLLLGSFFLAVSHSPSPTVSINATATAIAQQTAAARYVVQVQAAIRTEQALEEQNYARTGDGISDGSFVFDTFAGRLDVSLKEQAARALQHGDLAAAASLYAQAVNADPADGEALIYNEDLNIAQAALPYVTIVLGLGMDDNPAILANERSELQAAYEAQYEINEFSQLPHGLQLRILIASSGSNDAEAATLAQFVANRVNKTGNPDHIIAVVGWPSNAATTYARNGITGAQIPLISPTASNVAMSHSSPYFFRLSPSDTTQADDLALVATQQLQAKSILVTSDPVDADSVAVAKEFVTEASALGAAVVVRPQDVFTEGITSVAGYQNIVKDAVAAKANVILLPGTDIDAVRLAYAIGQAAKSAPTNAILANLAILGGPALDSPLLSGQGNTSDALLAQSDPQDMQRIHFLAYANPGELSSMKPARAASTTFATDWAGLFQRFTNELYNAPPASQYAMLTYDAVKIVGAAASLNDAVTGHAIQQELRAFGTGQTPPFEGVSGRIVFDDQGDPIDKALCLLAVESTPSGNIIALQQVVGTY